MAAPESIKPFTPEETRRILHHLQQPAVFMNMTWGWPVRSWTAEHLSGCFGGKLIRFRLGRKSEINTPVFETHCSYVEAQLRHFLNWTQGQSGADVGPFHEYPYTDYWAYADYKYIALLCQDQPSMFEDVKWREFGFEGRGGKESTLWIGTGGANTPCHLDAYGCNLVLQVQGRKRWHLFPPEDTAHLYPTRIPYEESSVFSQVDVVHPDLERFPCFQRARPHVVTLQPGQVLYVPRHWWHYVESVDPITVSVNSWIELEEDDVARVSEAVTKAVVFALKSAEGDDDTDAWLNPTEEGATSHNENMQYVNLAVRACAHRQKDGGDSQLREARPVKRDSTGLIRNKGHPLRGGLPSRVPFGPNLVPVHCQKDDLETTRSKATTDLEVKSSRNAEPVYPDAAPRTDSRSAECGSGCADAPITTNDLLDCLLHPDVVGRVTELLLERHRGSHSTTSQAELLL